MADEIAEPTPAPRKRSSKRRRAIRLGLIIAGVALVLAAFTYGGWRTYDHYRSRKQMTAARSFVEKGDFANATVLLRHLLGKHPDHLEATQLMAELMETVGSRAAISWRREMVRLQPGVIGNHLAFARAALRFDDRATAELALAGVPEAGRQTAAYHEVAIRLSAQSRQFGQAQEHLLEAARLDPDNELYQFNLALLDLGSISQTARAAARSKIEQMTTNPQMHIAASRALVDDALRRGDRTEALALAERVGRASGATFEDHVLQLDVLRRLKRWEFWWCLAQMEQQAEIEWSRTRSEDQPMAGIDAAVALLSWLNRWGFTSETLAWTSRMPEELRALEPVRMVLAETHVILNDWKTVESLTKAGRWGALDWKRVALHARALRAEGEQSGWSAEWKGALSMSRESPEKLVQLTRLASLWKWDDEVLELLWLLTADRTNQASAIKELNEKYLAAGKTRDLLRVMQFDLDATPEHLGKKNNVAYLSMLLGNNLEKAFAMAAEVYQKLPADPNFTSTYAYSLHLQGKTREGLRVLRLLSDEQLAEPSVALSYGLLLAAKGSKDEARRYIELAAQGSLLPEERTLIARVK